MERGSGFRALNAWAKTVRALIVKSYMECGTENDNENKKHKTNGDDSKNKNSDDNEIKKLFCFERSNGCNGSHLTLQIVSCYYLSTLIPFARPGAGVLGRPLVSKQNTLGKLC